MTIRIDAAAGLHAAAPRRDLRRRLPALTATLRPLARGAWLPLAILALWQEAAARGWMPPQILPAPSVVLASFVDLARSGEIARTIGLSLGRVAGGVALGAPTGLLLGILLGTSARARAYLQPLLGGLFAIPTLGWLPILILVFGIEEVLKVLIIAKAVLVPVTIGTAQGIRGIPPAYVEAARVMRLRPWTRLTRLTLPACLPAIVGGLRLGLSHAFIALVVVEMLAGTEGIGYMMVWGRTLFQVDVVIVGMLVVGSIGFLLDVALRRGERALTRWAPDHE